MAIENTYLLGKNITLGCGFDLQAKAPLDSRQTVPAFAGLQALIDNNAAYEGMIVYDEETKKTYQAQIVDDVLKFREFGINEAELKDLIASETTAAMEFKGATTALPENPAKGDMYKVTASFKVGEEDVKIGDSIVYDGEQWFIIPSGDDIEDTWRPVTGVDNDASLTFVAGDKLEKTVAADGTITYKHVAIDAPTNMNEEGDEQTRTYITQLITDNHGHIIGFKTATENVEDTNTTYEFEGQSDEATSVYFQVKSSEEESADVIYLNAYSKNEVDTKLADYQPKGDYQPAGNYKTVQEAIDAVETAKNTFIDTIAQDANGEITITTKAVDFSDVNAAIDAINDEEDGILANAKAYADSELSDFNTETIAPLAERVKAIEDAPYATEADVNAKLNANGWVDNESKNGWNFTASDGKTANIAPDCITLTGNYAYDHTSINAKGLYTYEELATIGHETIYAGASITRNYYDDPTADPYETHVFELPNQGGVFALVSDVDAAKDYADDELAKKVDKVTGYSLVSDNEIARLAEVDNYNDEEVRGLIGDNAKAIEDLEGYVGTFTHATAKTVVEYINAKTDGIATSGNLEALAGRVTANEGKITALETESAKHALKADVEAEFAKYTKTEELPTDLGDFTNNAGYAKTADVNTELDKKADKTQVATDIANAIAPLATTEALNGVDAKFAQYVTSASYAEDKADIDEAIADRYTKDEADGKFALIADAYDDEEVRGFISANADAIAAEKERAEAAEAGLQTQINTIMNNPDAEGAINSINEFTQYVKDHGTIADGFRTDIDKNKEDITANAKAVSDETARADEAEKALAGRLDTLEAIDHEAYIAADTALKSELNAEIAKKADASTVSDMDAAYKAADAELAAAIEAARVDASNQDAVILAEAQSGIAAVQAGLDVYKTDNNAAVALKANASEVYTKAEVEALISQAQTWGEF